MASYPADGKTIEKLLQVADGALYSKKRASCIDSIKSAGKE
jgi:predicted signal transduction protein with EAL and GGDEF domain